MKTPSFSKALIVAISIMFSVDTFAQGYVKPHDQITPKPTTNFEIESGPFKANESSLYAWECPEWFRDVKFGIWAHWGPQCQAEYGDWYARGMYIPGDRAYNYHVATYGSPNVYGFKEMCRDFTVPDWDPEALIKLYKEAGARYFVQLGNHHDNFDLWDSPYQEWNCMNMGPGRDLVGGWAEVCHKYGIRYGVSFHASHAWDFLDYSQDFDGNLTKAEGTGKWWEGYDPQELYAQRHGRDGDIHWTWDGPYKPGNDYLNKYQNRVLQCISKYNPDLIYFDDTVMPFWYYRNDIGMNILSHFYNHSANQHDGKQEVVVTGKILQDNHKKFMLWDVERGIPDRCQDLPWQTCTCIGNWHYDYTIYQNNGYKSSGTVVRMLVDIVSKNGNLLLSIPMNRRGKIDSREQEILKEVGAWMKINSSSIYGTRPWKVYGEGPLFDSTNPLNAQGFNEGIDYSNRDVRYVTRNDTVYATIMRWPAAGKFYLKNFGISSANYSGKVLKVKLLGYGNVKFYQGVDDMEITVPNSHPNEIAPVFEITFDPNEPSELPLNEVIDLYEDKIEGLAEQVSNNTGKPNGQKLDEFLQKMDEAKELLTTGSDAQKAEAARDLRRAYEIFERTGFNPAGTQDEVGYIDITLEHLLEKNNFSATDMGSRFGKPANWTVENFYIPQKDESKGVKQGIDKYPGYNCLMLGKWASDDATTTTDMTDARIYRTVHLKPGTYFFGASFNAINNPANAYIYVADEPLESNKITKNSIARLSISKCKEDDNFYGVNFTINEEKDVVLAFQFNLNSTYSEQEFRIKEVVLKSTQNPNLLKQTNISREHLIQATKFSRIDGQSTTTRYGSPLYWTVENYNIPTTSDGTRHGLDNYPGYDCLTLGIWGDRNKNNQGDLTNARVYRKVHLGPGSYYFGATYERVYNLYEAYIFAADHTLNTSDIPAQSLAFDDINNAIDDNSTFRGIYFELPQEQDVIIGFQGNLKDGDENQEFRAAKIKLVRYGNPNDIEEINLNDNPSTFNPDSPIYDLSGQRIPELKQGFNIVGGTVIYQK